MPDIFDNATRSRMMSGIRGQDTKPEMFVRRALHAQGFRYRLGGAGLPGRPDLVFRSRKLAVFIHGCFWHGHHCKYFKWPSSNSVFWAKKITENMARDAKNIAMLTEMGWQVSVIWECELRGTKYKLPNPAIERISYIINKIDHTNAP